MDNARIQTKRVLSALLALSFLFIASSPPRANAQTDGKTWTANIAGGTILLYELQKLTSENRKIKGAWAEAEAVLTKPVYSSRTKADFRTSLDRVDRVVSSRGDRAILSPGVRAVLSSGAAVTGCSTKTIGAKCAYDSNAKELHVTFVVGGGESFAHMRAQVIQTLILTPKGNSTNGEWRESYERLRYCWNSLIYSVAPASQRDSAPKCAEPLYPSPPQRATHAQPKAEPTPESPAIFESATAGRRAIYVDLKEAEEAFQYAPSLKQQIIERRVGPYAALNVARAEVLAKLAGRFYEFNPTLQPKVTVQRFEPDSSKAVRTPEELAHSTTVALGYFFPVQALDSLETALENIQDSLVRDIATKNACAFAASYWLPPINSIAMHYGKEMSASASSAPEGLASPPSLESIARQDFGAIPDC